MTTNRFSIAALIVFTISAVPIAVAAQDHPPMPAGRTHEQHQAQMKKEADLKEHGGMAMGFDQDSATHHFMLTSKGGTIAVTANDPSVSGALLQQGDLCRNLSPNATSSSSTRRRRRCLPLQLRRL